jgi:hypothetical protein
VFLACRFSASCTSFSTRAAIAADRLLAAALALLILVCSLLHGVESYANASPSQPRISEYSYGFLPMIALSYCRRATNCHARIASALHFKLWFEDEFGMTFPKRHSAPA